MPVSNPHLQPDSRASDLFVLVPLNDRARKVVSRPENRGFLTLSPEDTPQIGLGIGFHTGSPSGNTLVTLGRSGADITIKEGITSAIQCAFELHKNSGVVMLHDKSNCSTEVFGENGLPFEHGRQRQMVVSRNINTEIGMGGVRHDLVRFNLVWREDSLDMEEGAIIRQRDSRYIQVNNEIPTIDMFPRFLRIHISSDMSTKFLLRYAKMVLLGKGRYGDVYKVVDIDTGRILAAKIIQWMNTGENPRWVTWKREIETLSRCRHDYIVEYVDGQVKYDQVEIFTLLKEGNLGQLMHQNRFKNDPSAAVHLLHQMLQALDYLAFHGIVHRDVKPANILFTTHQSAGFTYQLTDFGLCNTANITRTSLGTPGYTAPEVLQAQSDSQGQVVLQTSKVDVWSLFVTLAFVLNAGDIREKPLRTITQVQEAITEAMQVSLLEDMKEMAIIESEYRASAAQMLVKLFAREGLTTPRNKVLPLHCDQSSESISGAPFAPRAINIEGPPALTSQLLNDVPMNQIEHLKETESPEDNEAPENPDPPHVSTLPDHDLTGRFSGHFPMPGAYPNSWNSSISHQ